jgi:hypothetical protein
MFLQELEMRGWTIGNECLGEGYQNVNGFNGEGFQFNVEGLKMLKDHGLMGKDCGLMLRC